jgi:hypothetical protein
VNVCYDTEFLEDGETIELISIGMVAEDGYEYYAVNRDMPERRIRRHPWLMENVVPNLPQSQLIPKRWLYDRRDRVVKPRSKIRFEVRRFLLDAKRRGYERDGNDLKLWADYASYDHVVLCQLFGRMIDLPGGIPMWTHDLRQELELWGEVEPPAHHGVQHNALDDARHVDKCLKWLSS